MIADFLAPKFTDIAGNDVARALNRLLPFGKFRFLPDFPHILAVKYDKPVRLLQMRHQNRFGLTA